MRTGDQNKSPCWVTEKGFKDLGGKKVKLFEGKGIGFHQEVVGGDLPNDHLRGKNEHGYSQQEKDLFFLLPQKTQPITGIFPTGDPVEGDHQKKNGIGVSGQGDQSGHGAQQQVVLDREGSAYHRGTP